MNKTILKKVHLSLIHIQMCIRDRFHISQFFTCLPHVRIISIVTSLYGIKNLSHLANYTIIIICENYRKLKHINNCFVIILTTLYRSETHIQTQARTTLFRSKHIYKHNEEHTASLRVVYVMYAYSFTTFHIKTMYSDNQINIVNNEWSHSQEKFY